MSMFEEQRRKRVEDALTQANDTINELLGAVDQHKDIFWLIVQRLDYVQAMGWPDRVQEQLDAITNAQMELDDLIAEISKEQKAVAA